MTQGVIKTWTCLFFTIINTITIRIVYIYTYIFSKTQKEKSPINFHVKLWGLTVIYSWKFAWRCDIKEKQKNFQHHNIKHIYDLIPWYKCLVSFTWQSIIYLCLVTLILFHTFSIHLMSFFWLIFQYWAIFFDSILYWNMQL